MHMLHVLIPLGFAALPQEGGVHPPSPVERLQQGAGLGEEPDEMVVLFQRVETSLREIDRLLYDASAGKPVGSQAESGIAEILRRSRVKNQEVLDDIDRMLQLAQERGSQQQQQQSGSSGQGQGQGQGQSQTGQGGPSQGSRDGSTQREQTPQGPGGERSQGDSSSGEGQPQGDAQQGDQPRGGAEQPGDGQTRAGDRPLRDPTGAGAGDGADGRWGDLPVHVRELFRAQGGADLPPHYRDWIDAYYRRLNRPR